MDQQVGLSESRHALAPSQLRVGLAKFGEKEGLYEGRYVDSFAVSSERVYVQPQIPQTPKIPQTPQTSEDYANSPKASQSDYVGSTLVNSGVEFHIRGEFDKAQKAFYAALKAQRLILGDENLCTAHTLGNIGAVFLSQGKLQLATESLEEALRMKARIRNRQLELDEKPQKIQLGSLLNNLGNLAYFRGDFAKSLRCYQAALKDLRSQNGPENECVKILHNIGRLHVLQKEWDAALSVLKQCERAEQKLYGFNHVDLTATIRLIGFAHYSVSSMEPALNYFDRALYIFREAYGDYHPDVGVSLLHIGMVIEATGDLKDAWEYYDKARDVLLRAGVDHEHSGLSAARRSIAKVERLILARLQESIRSRTQFIPIEARGSEDQFVSITSRDDSEVEERDSEDQFVPIKPTDSDEESRF